MQIYPLSIILGISAKFPLNFPLGKNLVHSPFIFSDQIENVFILTVSAKLWRSRRIGDSLEQSCSSSSIEAACKQLLHQCCQKHLILLKRIRNIFRVNRMPQNVWSLKFNVLNVNFIPLPVFTLTLSKLSKLSKIVQIA